MYSSYSGVSGFSTCVCDWLIYVIPLLRWADAKGPLALEFSSSEVKNLIRALFQNTERRAVALTKIK